ncbi:MAG: TaqI-like C-terminal specificity domain-containing protein, partial [Planctomycetota bacterium]
FVDGNGYSEARKRLAERYATLEITLLPDKAFNADIEVCLLIASDPIPHQSTKLNFRRVNDDPVSWREFLIEHRVSSETVVDRTPDAAAKTLTVPDLPEIWNALSSRPTLKSVADIHRGIEWNKPLTEAGVETGWRSKLVSRTPKRGFRKGIPPLAKSGVFQTPTTQFLSFEPEHRRGNAFDHDWSKPKVIVNKATRSRGHWRIAAFADSDGLACYQSYYGIWPRSDDYDEWTLAAILNSPVANAYISTREGKIDITKSVLQDLPLPVFTSQQKERLRLLIKKYLDAVNTLFDESNASKMLMEIDAVVLDAYHMPPRLEQKLLEFFRNHIRPVPHEFPDYFPEGEDAFFSLSDRLSASFGKNTISGLLDRLDARGDQ